ncbi:MAG: pyruvate dehydrogenase (acetyl-transferring) E1 component subunit alpha [Solirubrobacteraceae bacterium]
MAGQAESKPKQIRARRSRAESAGHAFEGGGGSGGAVRLGAPEERAVGSDEPAVADDDPAVAGAEPVVAAAPARADQLCRLLGSYETMLLIRLFEEEAERQYKAARIGGYCHLSSGQEACTVGAVEAMSDEDVLVTGYRCHGFALARGVPANAVMAELFGRRSGCAHGRGGSMHLFDVQRGFLGGWGIVGGQLPVATGAALSLRRRQRRAAVVCELGDGAVNTGAWHESLNLAALWRLPIVYLVVNNGYGMGTSVERASAEPELYKRATAFRMHGERVDGDDLDAVLEASERLLAAAREDYVPAVLEAVTYRYRGHSVADAGLAYRSREEIAEHRGHDPLLRVAAELRELGAAEDELQRARERAEASVADAVSFAESSPDPDLSSLAEGVYAPGSDEQFARMLPGSPFGERELVFAAGLGR